MKGDLQRDAIIEALRGAPDGLDTNQLAASLELHPNTVRWHLGLLEGSGLVRPSAELRHGRGRPSVAWRLTSEGATYDRDEYRLLATMLTGVVANDPDGEARAYEAGLRWGRDLHAAEPGSSVADLLDHQGFGATECEDCIEMRRCPFAALAEDAPQVICTLHRGIIDGALAAAGSDRQVERLDPFVEPGFCLAHLA
jgi:predicted ArsR family transcriptional regulator